MNQGPTSYQKNGTSLERPKRKHFYSLKGKEMKFFITNNSQPIGLNKVHNVHNVHNKRLKFKRIKKIPQKLLNID